jgi:hypothetical protein
MIGVYTNVGFVSEVTDPFITGRIRLANGLGPVAGRIVGDNQLKILEILAQDSVQGALDARLAIINRQADTDFGWLLKVHAVGFGTLHRR